MRFALALIAMTTILAAPAMADDKAKPSFGSEICQAQVPCQDDTHFYSSGDQLIQIANQCFTQNFGYSNPDGFFVETYGVGTDGCLKTKPDILPKGIGTRLAPHCCVVQFSPGTCRMRCDLVNQ